MNSAEQFTAVTHKKYESSLKGDSVDTKYLHLELYKIMNITNLSVHSL